MLRFFATAAILSAAIVTAQADDSLDARVHTAAVTACSAESSAALPASHYTAINQSCVARVSAVALRRLQADALAKTRASTALVGS